MCIRDRIGAFRLLLHIISQIGGTISKGPVGGKFRLPRRHQFPAVSDIVDVSDGKASPLFEKGADDFAVCFLLSFPAQYIPCLLYTSCAGAE